MPTSMDHLQRYTAASRSRQRTLEVRGTEAAELDAFEALMAKHGAALTARAQPGERAHRHRAEARLLAHHRRGKGPRSALRARRVVRRSRAARGASVRPRARPAPQERRNGALTETICVITLGGYDVRVEASQGEHRAITMALKMAELSCIADARGVHPVLLLDDVSSELDLARTALLFEFLRETPGQLLLTTTRPSLIDTKGLSAGERRDFRLGARRSSAR